MSAAPTANKQEYRKTMMLTEPVSKIIPKMAIPTIVAFIINSVYSLADTYSSADWGRLPRRPSVSTRLWTSSL